MNKIAQELMVRAVEAEMASRFQPLWALWCAWNSKAMSGDDFACSVGEMFSEATKREWNKRHPIEKGAFKVDETNPLSQLLV